MGNTSDLRMLNLHTDIPFLQLQPFCTYFTPKSPSSLVRAKRNVLTKTNVVGVLAKKRSVPQKIGVLLAVDNKLSCSLSIKNIT